MSNPEHPIVSEKFRMFHVIQEINFSVMQYVTSDEEDRKNQLALHLERAKPLLKDNQDLQVILSRSFNVSDRSIEHRGFRHDDGSYKSEGEAVGSVVGAAAGASVGGPVGAAVGAGVGNFAGGAIGGSISKGSSGSSGGGSSGGKSLWDHLVELVK